MKVIVLDDPNLESRLSSLATAHNIHEDDMLTRVLQDYFRIPSEQDIASMHEQELAAAL